MSGYSNSSNCIIKISGGKKTSTNCTHDDCHSCSVRWATTNQILSDKYSTPTAKKNRILLYCANTCCICCRSEICTTYEETRDKRRVKKVGLNGQILFKLTCKFNSMKHCILAVFITTAACFAFALDQQRDSSNSKRCQKKVSPAVARQSSGMNRKASRETTKKGNVASVAKTCNTVATLNAR